MKCAHFPFMLGCLAVVLLAIALGYSGPGWLSVLLIAGCCLLPMLLTRPSDTSHSCCEHKTDETQKHIYAKSKDDS